LTRPRGQIGGTFGSVAFPFAGLAIRPPSSDTRDTAQQEPQETHTHQQAEQRQPRFNLMVRNDPFHGNAPIASVKAMLSKVKDEANHAARFALGFSENG
jgi:hypothetical protein